MSFNIFLPMSFNISLKIISLELLGVSMFDVFQFNAATGAQNVPSLASRRACELDLESFQHEAADFNRTLVFCCDKELAGHCVYFLQQTTSQPCLQEALLSFSGKWWALQSVATSNFNHMVLLYLLRTSDATKINS